MISKQLWPGVLLLIALSVFVLWRADAIVQEKEAIYYDGAYDACMLISYQGALHRNGRYTPADHVAVIRFCHARVDEAREYDMYSERGGVESNLNPAEGDVNY